MGLLMISGSVIGASSGYDAHTSYLFLFGTFTCDFGSLLNSFSFVGLIWHFPGKQTVVLALINATYQASAMLPMVAPRPLWNKAFGTEFVTLGISYIKVEKGVGKSCQGAGGHGRIPFHTVQHHACLDSPCLWKHLLLLGADSFAGKNHPEGPRTQIIGF